MTCLPVSETLRMSTVNFFPQKGQICVSLNCFLFPGMHKRQIWNLKNQGYIVYVAYGTVNVIILPWLGWVKLLH
jgi:hypothetical protein